jgi:hypothetical protein
LRVPVEATHVPGRVTAPALAPDVRSEVRIAVANYVEALLVEIDGHRIDILPAELVVHGRGNEPVIVVGSTMSLVARSMIGISPEAYLLMAVVYFSARRLEMILRSFARQLWTKAATLPTTIARWCGLGCLGLSHGACGFARRCGLDVQP